MRTPCGQPCGHHADNDEANAETPADFPVRVAPLLHTWEPFVACPTQYDTVRHSTKERVHGVLAHQATAEGRDDYEHAERLYFPHFQTAVMTAVMSDPPREVVEWLIREQTHQRVEIIRRHAQVDPQTRRAQTWIPERTGSARMMTCAWAIAERSLRQRGRQLAQERCSPVWRPLRIQNTLWRMGREVSTGATYPPSRLAVQSPTHSPHHDAGARQWVYRSSRRHQ